MVLKNTWDPFLKLVVNNGSLVALNWTKLALGRESGGETALEEQQVREDWEQAQAVDGKWQKDLLVPWSGQPNPRIIYINICLLVCNPILGYTY